MLKLEIVTCKVDLCFLVKVLVQEILNYFFLKSVTIIEKFVVLVNSKEKV